MQKTLAVLFLSALALSATTITSVVSSPSFPNGPNLYGVPQDFAIEKISVTANNVTNHVDVSVFFNFGNNTSLAAYNLYTVELWASDLFFIESGTVKYGVPLVAHGGGTVNGRSTGQAVAAGSLYQINDIVRGVHLSQDLMPVGLGSGDYQPNRMVWLENQSGPNSLTMVAAGDGGTPVVTLRPGSDGWNYSEYKVDLGFTAPAAFISAMFAGNLSVYFTGTICGNDLLTGSIPEPGTYALAGAALLFFALIRKR